MVHDGLAAHIKAGQCPRTTLPPDTVLKKASGR